VKKQMKILIIRFSSIGDIILTSPVIRCIKLQKEVEIHFLVKNEFKEILTPNPYVDHLHIFNNNLLEIISILKKNNFDLVLDLQNNLRSKIICFSLGVRFSFVNKENLKKFLLIKLGVNFLGKHMVERYFNTIKEIGVNNDNKGLDFFINQGTTVDFNLNQKYIAWSLGGTYNQKKLTEDQILSSLKKINIPVVFLGGAKEKTIGTRLITKSKSSDWYNFCGKITLSQSAMLVQNSNLLLTNDSSLMHIGAAFNIPLISFWGCTKPILGFSPYKNKSVSMELTSPLSKRPCSKHGSYCKRTKKGCVKLIDPNIISESIGKIL
jgi:ADP-heptose:LPS heptosyltransferase